MSKSVVILTGAGISKESGLDTFRDADGIWAKVRLEDVATPEAFERDPDRVHAFYNHRRAGLLEASVQPNPAHEALARLEMRWRDAGPENQVLLVTQNIDDLHERAGSSNLLHMHGELLKARCLSCNAVSDWRSDMSRQSICPACGDAGGLRVDVVWFGEMPYHMERIYAALGDCDYFLSIGTSGNVYPAAGFVEQVRRHGRPTAQTIELNLEPSEGASLFHHCLHGPASEVVPAYVESLLDGT
ncbi:NAD-dependent deacylase [Denitrobaculum tricleocarpae]|uniref:NAD-dependent protein deacylase n=1 Tax=Denitrobaculum tricleocarpae TaxID=2591009 RepID=A0A545TR55_9PROT|nr:NAD-dependent deacylase [Denitrobaculum tricleocarpae]TQV79703.1 NAD-dependent deacylase [Denitrobaculum tricleocarpae]